MQKLVFCILALGIFFFVFLCFEIYLRFSYPNIHNPDKELGWILKSNLDLNIKRKNLTGESYSVNFVTNNNGSRFYGSKKKSEIKILVLGDSFTNMPYASNEDMWFSIFAKQLEAKINKKVYVEAIGAGGYGTLQQFLLAKRLRNNLNPNFIILQFCGNDFINNTFTWETETSSRYQYSRRPFIEHNTNKIIYYDGFLNIIYSSSFYEKVRIINRIDLLISVIEDLIFGKKFVNIDVINKSIDNTKKNLQLIKSLFPEKKIFVINCIVEDRHPYNKWTSYTLDANMIPIDVYDSFKLSNNIFYKDGAHFNTKGNLLVGNSLFNKFVNFYNFN